MIGGMWNPETYLAFADYRGRPFYDLLTRVAASAPSRVVDLGCGPGNLTETLGQRWPGATLEAWDSSPEMAAWLNQWAVGFAEDTPDCLHTATFFPEPQATAYVTEAITAGTQVFKVHIQVGNYDPNDPLLDEVWGLIEDAGVPVVIHCGSGPVSGQFTGPEPIAKLLGRYPRLVLIVAHMGMPEYSAFLDLAEQFEQVRLDTTMAFTPFVEETMPFPTSETDRLKALGEHILFGSDFPNIPYGYAEAIHHLIDLSGVDDTWRRNVLHDNAAKLFGLS